MQRQRLNIMVQKIEMAHNLTVNQGCRAVKFGSAFHILGNDFEISCDNPFGHFYIEIEGKVTKLQQCTAKKHRIALL